MARHLFVTLLLLALAGRPVTRAQTTAAPATEKPPVKLDPYTVTTDDDESYDETGMGTFAEELNDAPFSNDLVMLNEADDGDDLLDWGDEMAAISNPSPEEQITGEARYKLRGVTLPELRDGFIRLGVPESINVRHTTIIQGALIPVLGRAAPGGIRSTETARPRARNQTRVSLRANSHDRQSYSLEVTGPLIAKKLWHRVAVSLDRRTGPEQFAYEHTRTANLGFTWKHSRRASTRLALDYRATDANASPGIPSYRTSPADPILGPYLPLAGFNANGPAGEIFRRSLGATLQFDGAPLPQLSVRANLEGWHRDMERDNYPRPVFDLSTGLFTGVRRPRHQVQDDRAYVAQLEATWRFRAFGLDQKALLSAGRTTAQADRVVSTPDNATLATFPLTARRFDPYAPDYYRPAYTPAFYSRLLTDHDADSIYTAVETSDRIALRQGRWVISTGLRFDRVDHHISDHVPAASQSEITDHSSQLSHHLAVNWVAQPSRLLVFAAASTAFDPSTPVDSRTGKIQPNETTLGYETGLKTIAAHGRFTLSTSALLLYNRNIARRNPLYNDPVADANATQPQLVSAGEERFTGAQFEARWQPSDTIRFRTRGYYLHAISTRSPDLPEEVGHKIARLPALSLNLDLRRRPAKQQSGYTWDIGWQYIDSYVDTYGDATHAYLAYPGYSLLGLGAGYQWILPRKRSLSLSASARNALNYDLLARNARPGSDREVGVSASLMF